MSGRDLMISGQWYQDDPELRAQRRRCARLLERFNTAAADQDDERAEVLGELLHSIGPAATVMPRFTCSYGDQISIGANALVNYDCLLMDDAAIEIGDAVLIGPRSQLLTARHPVEDHDARRAGWERAEPITIGAGAWLAAGVLVGPGVTIGANAVVGLGSVVVKDVPSGVLAAGNPAEVIRTL
ncbi:MAG: sugar O-acetyltransferase [Pseudonocardia sp.]|nr:sugar O-acetyltransferase [Pseudonocardia sp.]